MADHSRKVDSESIEEPFTPLGKVSRGMITRGLPATAAGEAVREALLSYTIIER